MRVLVTGGGTGGHVNPALAIANTIKENIPDAEIAFVGTVRERPKMHHVNICDSSARYINMLTISA